MLRLFFSRLLLLPLSTVLSLALLAPALAAQNGQEELDPCARAEAALEADEPAEAIEAFEDCLASGGLEPRQEIAVYAQIGALHLFLDQPREALNAYDLVFAIAETQGYGQPAPALRRNRGIARAALGQTEGALEDLRWAASAAPGDVMTRTELGSLYQDLDRLAEAVAEYDAVVRLAPEWEGAWINRSYAFLQMEIYERAVDDARRAVELAPEDGFALNALCWGLIQSDQAALALPICEQAVAAEPEIGAIVHSLAAALEAVGREDEAYPLFARAHELSPDDPEITADWERTRS